MRFNWHNIASKHWQRYEDTLLSRRSSIRIFQMITVNERHRENARGYNGRNVIAIITTKMRARVNQWVIIKKAYDLIPKTWIIECLKLFKISDKIINFITKVMKNCNVKSAEGEQTRVEFKIQRCIFRWDSLSSLLFPITMMPLNYLIHRKLQIYCHRKR